MWGGNDHELQAGQANLTNQKAGQKEHLRQTVTHVKNFRAPARLRPDPLLSSLGADQMVLTRLGEKFNIFIIRPDCKIIYSLLAGQPIVDGDEPLVGGRSAAGWTLFIFLRTLQKSFFTIRVYS